VDRACLHSLVFRRFAATSDEIVNLLRTTLGPRQGTIAAAEDGVRIGAIPIGVLAQRTERPIGLVYAQRASDFIPAGTHESHLPARFTDTSSVRGVFFETFARDWYFCCTGLP
jgi:hypothetical protein